MGSILKGLNRKSCVFENKRIILFYEIRNKIKQCRTTISLIRFFGFRSILKQRSLPKLIGRL
jgi:hypothetical protein